MTITATAVLFSKTTLHMRAQQLITIGVLTPLAGIAGALAWPVLQRWLHWSARRVLITLIILASTVPAYGCVGFVLPTLTISRETPVPAAHPGAGGPPPHERPH